MNGFSVLVKRYGCSANQADGETLAGCRQHAGFVFVENPQSADVIVYNCCAVKGPTEDRMIAILKRAPRRKKMIVAGCLPVINFERLSRETSFDGVVGPAFGSGIVEVVRRVCGGGKVVEVMDALTTKPDLCLRRARAHPVV